MQKKVKTFVVCGKFSSSSVCGVRDESKQSGIHRNACTRREEKLLKHFWCFLLVWITERDTMRMSDLNLSSLKRIFQWITSGCAREF